MTLQRIVVPVDFSRHSDRAAHAALALARRHGASITLLHVDPLPSTGVVAVEPIYVPPELWNSVQREHLQRVDEQLDVLRTELAALIDERVDLDIDTRRGPTTEAIVEYAADTGADLLVMGSHGGSGTARFLLGSTTERVSRRASCPVLVSRPTSPEKEDEAPPLPPLRRALVGIDYSDFSRPLAQLAARVVGRGGVVELAHIWPRFYLSALDAGTGGRRDELVEGMERGRRDQVSVLERFAREINLPDVEMPLFVGAGKPAEGLLDRAAETGADLIVVGAHARSGVRERITGTVADRVLRHADLPVLLMPAAALGDED